MRMQGYDKDTSEKLYQPFFLQDNFFKINFETEENFVQCNRCHWQSDYVTITIIFFPF